MSGIGAKEFKSAEDSLRYERVKDAFLKGDFVYKITYVEEYRENIKVDPLENWILFSGGKVRYQISWDPRRYAAGSNSVAGKITKLSYSENKKKGTIMLTARVANVFMNLKITLFEGSAKAFTGGSVGSVGWIEPIEDAKIVRLLESSTYR